ncbi:MAG: site-2 protease family protein [Clostridia bacterium]|nr:site-2 protease family protein [Clostridia bacterium]
MDLLAIWSKAWPILLAILFFGIIIFVHELGHFIFAKLFKVKVNEFSMGMGPKLFSFGKKETKYSLRLFPIGGYVSMEGEDEDSEDDRAFGKKKVWQRFIIVAAGAVMNLILGFIVATILMSMQNLIGTTTIAGFDKDSVLKDTFKPGDRIVEINDKRAYSHYDLSFLMSRDDDGVFDFVIEREGEKKELKNVKFRTTENEEAPQKISIVFDFIIYGEKPGVLNSIKYGFLTTLSLGRMVWLSLFDLVTGQYGLSDLSGPIGTMDFIASAAQEAKADLSPVLMIMALITVNIGLFNLLPIPALDGGRLFFMLIEIIIRRPINPKYERWIHAAGMILLLLFMAVISFNDIWKLIKS